MTSLVGWIQETGVDPAQSHDWGMATDYAFIVHLCRTLMRFRF